MKKRTGFPCYICGEPTWIPASKATPTTKHGACWEHGTPSGYRKHGCRCDSCRAAVTRRGKAPAAKRLAMCRTCGAEFWTRRMAALHCSTACSQSGRWKGSRWISPSLRREIYERDGWTCQLCMEPVDVSVHYNHGRHPSLDHIIPRSNSVRPDHTPGNLRTTHRQCNIARGTGKRHSLPGKI